MNAPAEVLVKLEQRETAATAAIASIQSQPRPAWSHVGSFLPGTPVDAAAKKVSKQ